MSTLTAKRKDGTKLRTVDGPFVDVDAPDDETVYWLVAEEWIDWAEERRVYREVTQRGLRKQPRPLRQMASEWWRRG